MDGIISYQVEETTPNYVDEYKPYMYYVLPLTFATVMSVAFYKLFRACKPKQK